MSESAILASAWLHSTPSRVLAIDPGPLTSGWVIYDGHGIVGGQSESDNEEMIDNLFAFEPDTPVVIEWISNMGMAVGASIFETCYWAGRFAQAAEYSHERITRVDVKRHICGQTKAKDSNIRSALIDRFGGLGGKRAAVGVKAAPGPLYGCKSHMWSALALAVTWWDRQEASNGGSDTRD